MGNKRVKRDRFITIRVVNHEGAELQELDVVERFFKRKCTGVGKVSQGAAITEVILEKQLAFEKENK